MKSLTILLLAALLVSDLAHAQKTSDPKSTIVFFDDFSQPALDTTKWNIRTTGFTVNNEQQAYVNSASTLYIRQGTKVSGAKNGALIIEPVFSPGFITPEGNKFDFISGRIDTRKKMEFTYGSAAARIKMTAGSGLWPAFWALGNGKWPDTGEIDIMEYVGEPDWTSVALHGPGYSGETPLVNKVFFKKNFDATQWHIYSVDWTKDEFLFKVDGELMYRATRAMVEHYGKWAFDNPKYLILNFALGGAYPAKTNGVTTPYNGLPEATVQLIKNKQAKFVIDWVKVTQNN
jgi:beta-glucanase (GH16 family)